MGFTDNCDIFASFHEDGFTRIVDHVRSQRPSLFNYATPEVAQNPGLLCRAIDPHPIVFIRNNPLVTLVDPLPVPGTNFGVNFAVQLVELRIDFHPGDQFELPAELDPPLKAQRLAIGLTLCGGIGCPPDDFVERLIQPPKAPPEREERPAERAPIIVLPTRELHCFCLESYVTGGVRIVNYNGKPYLEPFLDGFEIVDIEPTGLENSLECYLGLLLRLVILPGLRFLLQHAPLKPHAGRDDLFPQPTNVVLSPIPVSAAVPNNPAIEEDQLKVFIKAEVIWTWPISPSRHPNRPSGHCSKPSVTTSGSPAPTVSTSARSPPLMPLRHIWKTDPLTSAQNTVQIKELDIKWDRLDLTLGLDIPGICVGGFCIIPSPFGCILRAPRICVFDDDPDISFTLPLGDLITSEISVTGSLLTKYAVNPDRPGGMNDWDAQDADPSLASHWQLFLDPQFIDVDIFDIADIVGDLLEDAVDAAIDNLLGFLPGFIRDIIRAILGPIIDLIRDILDIADDIQEWISDLLNVSFGILDFILQQVAEYFASKYPIHQIEDPYPILEAAANPNPGAPLALVPVKIPIRDLRVFNDEQEMVLEGNVG